MLKAKNYRLLTEAIEEGLRFGLSPVELSGAPDLQALIADCLKAIQWEISERFHVEDETP